MKCRKKLEVETSKNHTGIGYLDKHGYRIVDEYSAYAGGMGFSAHFQHTETVIVKIDVKKEKATAQRTKTQDEDSSMFKHPPYIASEIIDVDYEYAEMCYNVLFDLFSIQSTKEANEKFKERIEMFTNYDLSEMVEPPHKGAPIIA